MCGNIGFIGKEISKKLDTRTIKNGGLEVVTMPIVKVSNEGEKKAIEFGGYTSFVCYNKFREQEHNNIKFQKKMRSLRRNIKNRRLCQSGEAIQTGIPGELKS